MHVYWARMAACVPKRDGSSTHKMFLLPHPRRASLVSPASARDMPPNYTSGRPGSFSSTNRPPVPNIAINDELSFIFVDQTYTSASSSNSHNSISGGNSPLGQVSLSFPPLPEHNDLPGLYLPYSTMDQQLSNHQDVIHSDNFPAVLSDSGSLHGEMSNDQQRHEAVLPTNLSNLDLDLEGTSYLNSSGKDMIPTPLSASQPRRSSRTPSIASEAFSFVNDECTECQSRIDQLHDVENQVEALGKQLTTLQNIIRRQHSMLIDQQKLISNIQQEDHNIAKAPRRKRQFTTTTQVISYTGGVPTPTSDSSQISPKRGRFAPPQRKQTAETRQRGACVKCWKHKQRCEPGQEVDGPCKSCYEPTLNVLRIPCIRTHIVDLDLFRCSTGRNDTWTQRDEVWKTTDLGTYTSEQRTTLILTHGFGPQLAVKVRPYRVVRDDVTVYIWQDGQGIKHQLEMPHYALSDIDDLVCSVKLFIEQNQQTYIQHFVDEGDVPTFKALQIAQKMAITENNSLMQETLKMWTAARLIEDPWQICSQETLGLERGHHWWWIPITPIMDTQLDQVVTKSILLPLRRSVLQKLQHKIEKECRNSWFEILITIIILLSSLEIATRHDHEFARFFGHEYSSGRTRFEDYKLIESYFHSALTLLTHVKVIFDGRLPAMDTNINVSKLINACQEGDEKDYIIEVDNYVNLPERRKEFAKARNRHHYEKPGFWVHQLFLEHWMSQPISIQEI